MLSYSYCHILTISFVKNTLILYGSCVVDVPAVRVVLLHCVDTGRLLLHHRVGHLGNAVQTSSVDLVRVVTSVLEKLQVMAEQRKTLTQSMTRKRTPKTTQSQRSQLGPSSQSPVLAKQKTIQHAPQAVVAG